MSKVSNSQSSTRSSSPQPKDISGIILSEEKRYASKQYGLFFAFLFNISFFGLTPKLGQYLWPVLLRLMEEYSLSKFQVYFGGTFLTSYLVFGAGNLFSWLIYHLEHPFFESYKITEDPWPWQSDHEAWKKLLKKAIFIVLLNNLLVGPSFALLLLYCKNWEIDQSFAIEDLPDPLTLMMSVAFCMICEDFLFHHTHKLLHHPRLYPYVHKIHHEHIQTVCIAAEATHPIEFVLGNIIPLSLGVVILGRKMHFWTYLMWNVVRLLETIDGHCGYEFSWSPFRLIPFASSSQYHSFHHSHNVGNYSSFFSFWDTFYGTNKAYNAYYLKKSTTSPSEKQIFDTSVLTKLKKVQ